MTTENPTEDPVAMSTDAPKTAEDLNEQITKANLQFSLKNYEAASELYSEATELQAQLNGELAPENAELLYSYGRSLFKLAISKNDVLGGQVAGGDKPKSADIEKALKSTNQETPSHSATPFFQLAMTEDEDDEEEEEEAGEEEDDFGTAYEILDMARLCYEKQLDALRNVVKDESGEAKGKGKATTELSPEMFHVMERLANTHNLQADISLENERFDDAAEESKATMELRKQLYPVESEQIAEGHYMLTLALEFAFFKNVREAKEQEAQNGQADQPKIQVDPKMLYDAVENMALAVKSCEARISLKEKTLAGLELKLGDEAGKLQEDIQNTKEIAQDMKIKLADLSNNARPLAPNNDLTGLFGTDILAEIDQVSSMLPTTETLSSLQDEETVSGTAAQKPGESVSERQARIDQVAAQANDLSGLIRKKKPATDAKHGASTAGASSNGKRKLEADEETSSEGKKVKFDE
ncbi:hypothetical protein BT63DRAFT_429512, partial [Microthyrium microscopicum]